MFKQVMKVTFGFSFLVGALVTFICMLSIPFILYQGSWYYLKGYLLENYATHIEVDKKYWEHATRQRYGNDSSLVAIPTKTVLNVSQHYAVTLKGSILKVLKVASFFANGTAVLSLLFFLVCGQKSKSKQHLSGRKISSAWIVALKLKLTGRASSMHVGPIPMVKGSESQHMLITGGTGTGKSNCLHHILSEMREQKVIIIDTTGVFLERYYSAEKDIILSPFHEKSAKWHPWAECKTTFDFAEVAESFIPHSHSELDNYWRQAARALFSSTLQKCQDSKKNSELIRWLLFEPLSKVCHLLQGTKAASHMDINAEKTASCIRSVASTFLECLECLDDSEDVFSIRDWVSTGQPNSWLFLHCTPSQRAAVRPLLSTWISSAIKGLLTLEPDLKRRIWFIIDELPSLQKVKNIETLLTEGRKYGGCAILSLQSPSQLESIYGREVTKTIIGNTLTKVIFAEQDPEIAERISKSFGDCEMKEFHEGISYGAHEARDGVNLSSHMKTVPIVPSSKILSLPKNTAFVKLPGNYPIVKIKLKIAQT
jgi:type IV conjugative transfer system coupling protein TraD